MAINTAQIQELIQTNIASILVHPLEETSSFMAMGARVFDTAGPISIPKLTGGFTPDWVGESEQIPEETEDIFDAVELLPSTMKSVKSIVRISNESLRQSSQALDAIISARLVTDTAAKIDTQAWSAAGDGVATPKGVLHADNVAQMEVLNAAGAALSVDMLHSAFGLALNDDVPLTGLRWVMSPGQLTGLRKLKTTDGRYLVQPDVTVANGLQMLGVPVQLTKRMAADATGKGQVLLLNPQSWAVARDMNPTVKVLVERYADYDQVGIRVVSRYDWGLLQPDANVLITGLAA